MPGTPKTDDRLSLGRFLELPGIDERPHLESLGGKVHRRISEAAVGMEHLGRGQFRRGGE